MESRRVANPKKLRRLIESNGLTEWRLAKDAGVHGKTVANALAGEPLIERTVSQLSQTLSCEREEWLMPRNRIDLGRLPVPTEQDLFIGRKVDTERLDEAWESGRSQLIQVVGDGGIGKSALIWHWLRRKESSRYQTVTQALGWTFYSTGRQEYSTDSREFLEAAVRHFQPMGLSLKTNQRKNAAEIGRSIAELFSEIGGILVLDGAEPMQYPRHISRGGVRDPAFAFLLRRVRTLPRPARPRRLVIITTRWRIPELSKDETLEIGPLSPHEGAELLEKYRIKSSPGKRLFFLPSPRTKDKKRACRNEFRTASREFAGHPLALVLLASYLLRRHDGDLRLRVLVPAVPAYLEDDPHRHARRIMSSYDTIMFPDDSGDPRVRSCRQLLAIIGLLDRPVSMEIIDLLRAQIIAGVTDSLSDDLLHFAIEELRDLHILSQSLDSHGANLLDTHPLVREHFGTRLKETKPDEWRQAHDRLYRHFVEVAAALPETIDEMAPLFHAVVHGCEAGHYQEVFTDVYEKRMYQKDGVTWKKLGLLSADLSVMSAFCEKGWLPVADLKAPDRAFVLVMAGFLLRCLGCLREAVAPLRQAKTFHESVEKASESSDAEKENAAKEAANDADNLSQCSLAMGELNSALTWAREGIRIADLTVSKTEHKVKVKVVTRSSLGHALHQMCRLEEAESVFIEAEGRWNEEQDKKSLLDGKSGYRFCDLLLTKGNYAEILHRTEQTLKWAEESRVPLDIGLDSLSRGRAYLHHFLEYRRGDIDVAFSLLDKSVDCLRQADTLEYLPLGLLARSDAARELQDWSGARIYLDEALEIAESCGLQLNLVDCHLAWAKLYLMRKNEKSRARRSLDNAIELIHITGYKRRIGEVQNIERHLK